jgi:Misato Segment II tubulin-like domain
MHEILSLQHGERSNYLATHFWNIQVASPIKGRACPTTDTAQESYFTYSDNGQEQPAVDHDVHFRAGIGVDGTETYTPRTVIYDLKGGFGSLRKYNALYALSEESPASSRLW